MKAILKILVIENDDNDFERLQRLLADSRTHTFKTDRHRSVDSLLTIPVELGVDLAIINPESLCHTQNGTGSNPYAGASQLVAAWVNHLPVLLMPNTPGDPPAEELSGLGFHDMICKVHMNAPFLEKMIINAVERYDLKEELKGLRREPLKPVSHFHHRRNRLLVDLIGEGIAFVDQDEIIKYANPTAAHIFGVSEGRLVGRGLSEFMETPQFEAIKSETQKRRNGEKTTYEIDITTPAGQRRTLLVTGNPWYDDGGRFIGSFGVFRDISDRIQSHRELLLLRKALQTMKVGVTITNLKREIIYINPAEAHMHGYTVDEISNKESRIFGLRKEWKELTVEEVKRMESWERESVNKHKDGSIFPVHLVSDVVKDDKGEPFGIVTCCMDITARKKAEEALKASSEYLRGILESQLDLVIRTDAGDRFTYANDAYCRTFGKKRTDLLGHRFIPEIVEEDLKKQEELRGCLEMPPYRVYYEQRTKTVEGWRWLAWQGYAIRDDNGKLVETQSVGRDVTEQKEMEEELRLYATIDTMTGVQNRRTGMLLLEKKMHMANRSASPLVVCFVDIDNLKYVNDKFGHWEGDELIRQVSNILQGVLRQSDTICRLGGDEFLIIFPNCSMKEAQKIWARVDEKLERVNRKKEKSFTISFSHGFAEFLPGREMTSNELIAVADKEMYKQKLRIKAPGVATPLHSLLTLPKS